jgi:hypothetical protein
MRLPQPNRSVRGAARPSHCVADDVSVAVLARPAGRQLGCTVLAGSPLRRRDTLNFQLDNIFQWFRAGRCDGRRSAVRSACNARLTKLKRRCCSLIRLSFNRFRSYGWQIATVRDGRCAAPDRNCGRLADKPHSRFAGNRPTIQLCEEYGSPQPCPHPIAGCLKYPLPQRDTRDTPDLNGVSILANQSANLSNLSQLITRLSSNVLLHTNFRRVNSSNNCQKWVG